MPQCVTVPQSAVAAGKVMTDALPTVPLVPDDAPVVVPCVPVQADVPRAIATRAYDPPVTSVPVAESEQAVV